MSTKPDPQAIATHIAHFIETTAAHYPAHIAGESLVDSVLFGDFTAWQQAMHMAYDIAFKALQHRYSAASQEALVKDSVDIVQRTIAILKEKAPVTPPTEESGA